MTIQIINGPIIAAGESLSDGVDLTIGELVRITMPGDWVYAGGLTFQISSDGIYYNNLVDRDGKEVTVAVIPGSALVVPVDISRAAAFIKFRSGPSQNPVAQPMLREFAVAIKLP